MRSDWELLDAFSQNNDQVAFAELVRRHVDFVYSAARRGLGGGAGQEAEDVAQAVFLLLSRKAGRIPRRGSLTGWLFNVSRLCCANARKMDARRKKYERAAGLMRQELDQLGENAGPELDAGLAKLGEHERQAILVRFFEKRTLAETAAALGITAEATEKRLERGIAKLRQFFIRKGFAVPAGGVAAVLGAPRMWAAPTDLAARIASGASDTATRIAQGASAMMSPLKTWAGVFVAAAAVLLAVFVFLPSGHATAPAIAPSTNAKETQKWETYTDATRHFHLDYPPSWKVNSTMTVRAHYTMVLAALNSAGKENFTVQEIQTDANTYQLNGDIIAQLVPVGTAYIDISWQEGPGGVPQFGPGIHELEAADLSGLLQAGNEAQTGALIAREISFSKWGKSWVVTVYMQAPVAAALRAEVDKVLASFRFDGVPAGDAVWALGLAWKRLPAEADPEKYTRQGGSSEYYCGAQVNGDEVVVTFTKHVGNTPVKNWTYRVTAKGEVIAEGEKTGG